eukprot:NODE_9348_length_1430_cov_9.290867.p1 GENE.NODE_9348_length_1430_cov_9.290867~~NODE_9348_length_1430_cov_9.290867.p1  ORF type:complete len:370 (-),score=111.98 NODE_9348_length_1430_cov_9.290867:238-1347(-)
MADILDDTSSVVGSAPLTASQTVSIARSLQDEINTLASRMDGMMHELNRADSGRLCKTVEEQGAKIYETDDKMRSMDTGLSGFKKDLQRQSAALLKLQAEQADIIEQLHGSKDTMKLVDGRLENFRLELAPTVALAQACRDQLDNHVGVSLRELHGEVETLHDHLRKFSDLGQTTRMELIGDRANTRTLQQMVDTMRDNAEKLTTHVGVIDTRGQESIMELKKTTNLVNEMDTAMQKLLKDMDMVKDDQEEMKSGSGGVASHLRKLSDTVVNAERERQVLTQRVEKTCAELVEHSGMLDMMRMNYQGVKDGQDNAMKTLRNFKGELENVQATANSVRSGLKETRMLVLPNLNVDEGRGHHKGISSQRGR